jgi:hypothetical protein
MNTKLVPANERSSADGDCKIRKVLQGLKPHSFLGLCGTRPRGCPGHALLQRNGTLAVSRVSRSKLDIRLSEIVFLEFYWYPTHSAEISEKQVLRLHFVPLRRMGHGGLR